MSGQLSAAAAAMGLPEDLVRRSAEARAAETGGTADDILAAWAGGEAAPAGADTAAAAAAGPAPAVEQAAAEAAPAPTAPAEAAPATAAPAAAAQAQPQVVTVPAGPFKPPTLVGGEDNPATVMVGALGLFLVVLVVGLVGPAVPMDEPGARTSDIAYSGAALDGQAVYESQGCHACHTQMVRPVVADVGLGDVTLNDSNQITGTRRFGPDLSDVGSRRDASQLETVVSGDDGAHPPFRLAEDDMAAVVAYLAESRTSR